MSNPILLILFGMLVGVFSGVMGLGGGAIMIPIMVLLFGLTQQQAHGTSLAVMIPPVTLPAVINYFMTRGEDGSRNVDLSMALWMAIGVACASYFGASIANALPKQTLATIFGLVLIYISAYTAFGKEHLIRSVLLAAVLVIIAGSMILVMRWYDKSAVTQTDVASSIQRN